MPSASVSSASSLPRITALNSSLATSVDHAALVHHVLQAIDHPGVGGQAVAPGTAGFLVVAFDVLGHVQVRDEAHVGLVDAHAEGNRRHHHHAVFAQESVLALLAQAGVQPGVVGHGLDAGALQHLPAISSTRLRDWQ